MRQGMAIIAINLCKDYSLFDRTKGCRQWRNLLPSRKGRRRTAVLIWSGGCDIVQGECRVHACPQVLVNDGEGGEPRWLGAADALLQHHLNARGAAGALPLSVRWQARLPAAGARDAR